MLRFAAGFLLIVFGLDKPVAAQPISFELKDFQQVFELNEDWEIAEESLDQSLLKRVEVEVNDRSEVAKSRFIKAISKTYPKALFKGAGSNKSPISFGWIENETEILVLRIFFNTVHARAADIDQEVFIDWLGKVNGAKLDRTFPEIVQGAWSGYSDLKKRERSDGFVSISSSENRAFAWGVPPDFVEIVISKRVDCEFLPAENWFMRQLCP